MVIKNKQELEILREGGQKLAEVLEEVARQAKVGTTTQELDDLAEKLIREAGGTPSFKGYKTANDKAPYPASLCVSVNSEVVHGIPSPKKILKLGDVVGLDIGMEYKGFFTDTATSVIVDGRASEELSSESAKVRYLEAEGLVNATKKALEVGIAEVRAGVHVGDIGFAIQRHLEDQGFGVVRELVGHGVGQAVHEDPEIPNWGARGDGYVLQEGEVIAIEPMATAGGYKIKLFPDGWTWATKDGSLAAHFEHTLVVTKDGAEVLTQIE